MPPPPAASPADLFAASEWKPSRVLCWFSCGVTSAVACKLALASYPDAEVVRIVLAGEHPDSDRFAADCGRWFSRPVATIRSDRYADHFQVISHRRYINGPAGALCTYELKRRVRENHQRPGDLHVFGFDAGEADRVEDFRENNPGLPFDAPLIDAGLTKADCKAIVGVAGISLPAMYRLGYANNNCIGCVKGGMGYWNRIRVDFPDVFARMAILEREIGATALRRKGERLYLDQLDPAAGRFADDQPADCGPLCQSALARVGLDAVPEAEACSA